MKRTQVIIIGAGPTGLALACQLIRYNIDFLIIEKNKTTTPYSKAMVVHARTLEIFKEYDLDQKAVESGQMIESFNIVINGRVRGHIYLGKFGTGLSEYPFVLGLEQSKTEKIHVDFLGQKKKSILWESEVTNINSTAKGVTVTYKDNKGALIDVQADYLVGCDGSHSMVRHALALPLQGSTLENTFYVADATVKSDLFNKKEAYMNLVDDGFVLFFALENKSHYRIIGVVPREQQQDTYNFEDIERIVKNQLNIPLVFEDKSWYATYKAHSRMVSSFSQDRCFLAGDAAHIHTPAGGQGMNTGIQDAYNLAWKLALVLHNKASGKLLETYSSERTEVAKQLLATTDKQFEVLTGSSFVVRYLKKYVFPLVAKLATSTKIGGRTAFKLMSQIAVKYPDSSLTIKSKIGSIEAGDRMPYFQIDGNSIYEQLTTPAFKILWFGEKKEVAILNNKDLKFAEIVVTEIPSFFKGATDFYILLRPDNYVSYIGKDVEKIDFLISRL
ncbi:MAG: FAD-dependent monooxygenase [Chitinophagales bacterium]